MTVVNNDNSLNYDNLFTCLGLVKPSAGGKKEQLEEYFEKSIVEEWSAKSGSPEVNRMEQSHSTSFFRNKLPVMGIQTDFIYWWTLFNRRNHYTLGRSLIGERRGKLPSLVFYRSIPTWEVKTC